MTRKLIIGIDGISEAGVCLDLHLTKIGTSFVFIREEELLCVALET